MKTFIKTFAIFSLIFLQNALFAQYAAPENSSESTTLLALKKAIQVKSETVPMGFTNARFSYDETAMENYFSENLEYPELAFDYGIEGVVMLSFQVNADGSLSEAKIEKSLGFGCDKVALEAVENMPNWIPAQYGARKVATRVLLPIGFRLE